MGYSYPQCGGLFHSAFDAVVPFYSFCCLGGFPLANQTASIRADSSLWAGPVASDVKQFSLFSLEHRRRILCRDPRELPGENGKSHRSNAKQYPMFEGGQKSPDASQDPILSLRLHPNPPSFLPRIIRPFLSPVEGQRGQKGQKGAAPSQ